MPTIAPKMRRPLFDTAELTGSVMMKNAPNMVNMELLLGPIVKDWVFVVASDYTGLLLAILPPGAFIITGLLIAAKNVVDARIEKANKSHVEVQTGSKRVRVTGEIA